MTSPSGRSSGCLPTGLTSQSNWGTTGLTMVASPRALGMIRSDYSVAVRKALRGELDKDLVKMPVHEIEKQLLS